jgi:hypothetical protein
MKFYYFGGQFTDGESLEKASTLDKNNFDGLMFTYDATQGDMFVRTAKDIKANEKIKYLVAIRPYTISPQYLYTIHDSINEIMEDRLQINFIAGYIKDHESDVGGIVTGVNDQSTSVDRSNYLIDFVKTLNEMSKNRKNKKLLDFYISTTNSYIFNVAKKYKNKIILPYHVYKRGFWSDTYDTNNYVDIKDMEVMIAMTPIIRKNEEELGLLTNYALKPVWKKGEVPIVISDVEYFTHESFSDFVEMLEKDGINHLLINAIPPEEVHTIVPFIKQFVESKKTHKVKEAILQ